MAVIFSATGRIYTSPEFGVTWTLSAGSPTNVWFNIASSADGGRLFACASPGGIYISVNSGGTWSRPLIADQNWHAVACSDDGTKAVAAYNSGGGTTGSIYYWQIAPQQTSSSVGTNGFVSAGPGTAVELQYIGNNAAGNASFLPISGTGTIWGN